MTAGAPRPAPGHRWLRPAFVDLLAVFLLILVVGVGSRRLFGDADAATHVATGRFILEHHRVPKADPFSGTRAGTEWFAHEWLADLGFAVAHRACGWNGVLALAALLLVLSHAALFRLLVGRRDDVLAAFGSVVAAAAVASSHWLARPHLFTVLCLVLWIVVLERVVAGRSGARLLLWLPPLMMLWANLHGGFVLGFGILGCYVAGELPVAVERLRAGRGEGAPGRRSRLGPLLAAGAASLAAALCNPWGWRLPQHLVRFFGTRGAALSATTEFEPAALDDRAGLALWIFTGLSFAGAFAGLWVRSRRARSSPKGGPPAPPPPLFFHPGALLSLALTTSMAFGSIRHVDVMSPFGALFVSGGLTAVLRLRSKGPTLEHLEASRRREARSGGAILLAVLALVWGLAWRGLPHGAGFDPRLFPVDAVAALREDGSAPRGPVLTPDVWGGYLILEWPAARVFVDGRWDMYGDEFFRRYSDIYLAHPGWSESLAASDVTLAILPRDAPLVEAMAASPEWIRWRADETSVVFRKRS